MKKLLSAILALILVFSLAACGKSDTNVQSDGDDKAVSTVAPQEGKTIYFSTSEGLNTIEATTTMSTTTASMLFTHIYDPLVFSNHDGTFEPGLATSWEAAEDGMSITFQLRQGVKYTNGNDFNAEDVKFTLEYLAASPKTANSMPIASVDILDDYQVVVNFTSPNGEFFQTQSVFGIWDKETYDTLGESEAFVQNIGTGAYKIENFAAAFELALVKNEDWWGWAEHPEKVNNIDRVVFKPITEDTTRVAAIRSGELDLATYIPADQIDIINAVDGYSAISQDGQTFTYMCLQCKEGTVFGDKKAREAFNHSIDRQLIVDKILGSGSPAYWFVTEGCLGYEDTKEYNQYDPELAKQLLSESSYAGQEVRLVTKTGAISRGTEVMQAMASMMTEVGFNVTLEIIEEATFAERRSVGDYDLAFSIQNATGGSSLQYLYWFWAKDFGCTNYKNDIIVDAITTAYQSSDPEVKDAQIRIAFEEAARETAPHTIIFFQDSIYAKNNKLERFLVYPDNYFDFHYAYLAD